jgi:cell division protein FtsZ
MKQAREGIEELKQHVDSLIVINNNKLREIYGKLGFKSGFAKADEILATASRGIAEVITQTGHLNIDLNDARTVLSNSGTAIMGTGTASGEDRAIRAVKSAIESPLLDNNHIRGAKKVLLLIVSGTEEVTFEEMGIISDFIQDQVTIEGSVPADIIMGVAEDDELGDAVNVTVVATGFHEGQIVNPLTGIPEKVKYDLDDIIPIKSVVNEPISTTVQSSHLVEAEVKHILEDDLQTNHSIEVDQPIEEVASPLFSENEVKEDRQQVSMSFEFDIEQPAIEPTDTFTEETNEEKFLETTSDSLLNISELRAQNSQTEKEDILDEPLISEELDDRVVFSLEDDSSSIDESSGSKDDLEEQSDSEPTSEKIIHTLSLEEDSINIEPSDESPLEIQMESTQVDPAPELTSNLKSDSAVSATSFEVSEDVAKEPDSDDAATEQPIAAREKTIVSLSSHSDTVQEQIERAQKRKDRLQKFNYRFRNNSIIDSAEQEPAYKRQGIELNEAKHSTDDPLSRTSLTTDQDGLVELKSRNSFLHDNVD